MVGVTHLRGGKVRTMVGVSRGIFRRQGLVMPLKSPLAGALFLMLRVDILALGSSSQENPEPLVAPSGDNSTAAFHPASTFLLTEE